MHISSKVDKENGILTARHGTLRLSALLKLKLLALVLTTQYFLKVVKAESSLFTYKNDNHRIC